MPEPAPPVRQPFAASKDADDDDKDGVVLMSTDEAIQATGYGFFQHRLLLLCGLVWTTSGQGMLLTAFLLPEVRDEWGLTSFQESLIGAVTFVGVGVGAVLFGYIADKRGRKLSMQLVAVSNLVFSLGSTSADDQWQLMAWRFLVGIPLGGAPVAFSLFAEYCPLEQRGRMLTIVQGGFWSLGGVLAAVLAWVMIPNPGWRWFVAANSILILAILAGFRYIPETARYYVAVRNDHDTALELLREVGRLNNQPLPDNVRIIMPVPEDAGSPRSDSEKAPLLPGAAGANNDKAPGIRDLFSKQLFLITILVWFLWCSNVFVYYGIVLLTPDYFGNEDDDANLSSLLTAVAELPGLVFAIFIIDRIGRKKTQALLFGLAGLGLFALAFEDLPRGFLTFFAVIARGSINGAFAATYVYTPEVYPSTIRVTAIGAASAIARVAGVGTAFVSKVFNDQSVLIPVFIFGSFAAASVFASLALPIETSGRAMADTLDAVDAEPTAKAVVASRPDPEDVLEAKRPPRVLGVGLERAA